MDAPLLHPPHDHQLWIFEEHEIIHQLKTDNPRISRTDIKLNITMLELERANKRLVEASYIGHIAVTCECP